MTSYGGVSIVLKYRLVKSQRVSLVLMAKDQTDFLSYIPWQAGKRLLWAVTVSDTLAPPHLATPSPLARPAAEAAALKKIGT